MKVKKVSHILDDGHIDYYIEFNPFKLSSREVLVVNGKVIASTVYSRQRRQSVLNIDYFFAGKCTLSRRYRHLLPEALNKDYSYASMMKLLRESASWIFNKTICLL